MQSPKHSSQYLLLWNGSIDQKAQEKVDEEQVLKEKILTIFKQNRSVYGTRKIKDALMKIGITASRSRVGRLMVELGIQSKCAQPSYKPMTSPPNEESFPNVLNRDFKVEEEFSVLVSDLTYVKVWENWNYIWFLIDIYKREIVGFSLGERKDSALVQRAFKSVNPDLGAVKIFYTDRGSEFKNVEIDKLLLTHKIERSFSRKGNPYGNVVAGTWTFLLRELVQQ